MNNGKDAESPNTAERPESLTEEREPIDVVITDIKLEALESEAREFKDKYLRLLAELENSRKRLIREREDMIQYALENLIVDFIVPIDQMDSALGFTKQMSDDVKNWAKGFEMILSHFKDVLTNNGVTPFQSVGKPFNPNCHEAIEIQETSEYPPEVVIKETVRGYKMKDRTIRPARVVVSKMPTATKDAEQEQKN